MRCFLLKIVIITSVLPKQKFGIAVVTLNHAKALQELGHEVSIFCRGDSISSTYLEGVKVNTFKYIKYKNPIKNFLKTHINSLKGWDNFYSDGEEPDIIHGHDYLLYRTIGRYKKVRNVGKVFTVHDPLLYHRKMVEGQGYFLKNIIISNIEKEVYKLSDKIHYISKYTLERLELLKENDIPKLNMISNWADYDRFNLPINKEEIRKELGIAENEFIIFTVRGLHPRTGVDRLIKGFANVNNDDGLAKLFIGGKGPLKNKLVDMIKDLNVKNVNLLGYISDDLLVKWYQAANVVVIPSIDGEGFGLPILESMACGTPVLGTPVCAIPEVLDGLEDRLFDGISSEDIGKGLEKFYKVWLENKDTNSSSERRFITQKYSRENIVREIIEDYESLIK